MRPARGFTLIELLVVISIIAILSVVGITVFTGVQKSARDAKRRGDIEAISKAFEVKYNNKGSYEDLAPANNNSLFASGSFPKDPKGVDYTIIKNNDTGGFRICAALQDNSACSFSSGTCFCKTSSQANPPDVGSGSVSVVTNGDTLVCPTSGLVGYWKFNDIPQAGIVVDSAGGNTCTWNGSGSHWVTGKFVNAGNFNGVDDQVRCVNGASLSPGTGNFSLTAWINTTQITEAGGIAIGNGANLFHFRLSNGHLDSRIHAGTLEKETEGTHVINDGIWHFVAVTFDRHGNMIKYVDTVLDATDNISDVNPTSISGISFYIGQEGNRFFNGAIDDVRMYNRVLSPQEIFSIFNSGNGCIP